MYNEQLDMLKTKDFHNIDGKFHSHITVSVQNDKDLERLRTFCREKRVKLTVIDLDGFDGQHQRDVMTTQHYKRSGDNIVVQIIEELRTLCDALSANHFGVVRVKLEHESLPTLPVFNNHNYREVHIKLRIKPEDYTHTMTWLKTHAPDHGYVPSNNPNDRKQAWVTQFINMRIYEGSLSQTDQKVDAVVDFLTEHDLNIVEVKRETTVFDTNLALDRWWT